MTKIELFVSLPDIEFATCDLFEIESSIITEYENVSDRKMENGDPVRLFLESIPLVIIQQQQIIDYAAKMNLLAYSQGDYLDHIGAQLGVYRLPASTATCTLKFTFSAPNEFARTIPVGTRATNGQVIFATTEVVEVSAGEISAEAKAQCATVGTVDNGFLPGQIKKLVDVLPLECAVVNSATTSGGAEIESDENFRERIQLAPEIFSNAGSRGAYEYYTRSAHAGIVDVAVVGPTDTDTKTGTVDLSCVSLVGVAQGQTVYTIDVVRVGLHYTSTVAVGTYYGEYRVNVSMFSATLNVSTGVVGVTVTASLNGTSTIVTGTTGNDGAVSMNLIGTGTLTINANPHRTGRHCTGAGCGFIRHREHY